jgi:hypothetical protein
MGGAWTLVRKWHTLCAGFALARSGSADLRAGANRATSIENGGSAMLVLTRKNLESVIVGGSDGFGHILKVTVIEIGHGKVKLGF